MRFGDSKADIKFKDVKACIKDGFIYLDVTLTVITNDGHVEHEVNYPNVRVGVNASSFARPNSNHLSLCGIVHAQPEWDCILEAFTTDKNSDVYATDTIVNKIPEKMTMAELEEKFGYPIEIVTNK